MDSLDRLAAALDRSLTDPVRARLVAARWSDATAAQYAASVTEAREWWERERRRSRDLAAEAGITIPEGDALPAFMPWPPWRLALYVAHLAQQSKAPATIRKTLSALKAWHRLHGFPVPDGIPALAVLQDHDASLRESGWEPRRAEPITLGEAVRIIAAADRSTVRGRRDAAVLMLAFSGMLATTVLSGLKMRDVVPHPDGLTVARPEGDPLLIAHWRVDGVHHEHVCPVEAIIGWHTYMDGRGAPPGSPFIRPVAVGGRVAGLDPFSGPVSDNFSMSPARFSGVLTWMLDAAGYPAEPRPTLTDLRLGGVVHRRLGGATVAELSTASGLSTVRSTLLDYVAVAEERARSEARKSDS